MVDMLKKINAGEGISLDKLDLSTGLVAFENSESEYLHPFIIVHPERLVRGYDGHLATLRGLKLTHLPEPGKKEDWTLYIKGNIINLWSPKSEGEDKKTRIVIPNVELSTPIGTAHYVVESAYSGREEIAQALEDINPFFKMQAYANIVRYLYS